MCTSKNPLILLKDDPILAKLKMCGFSACTLNLTHSYLKNRKQKGQINKMFSLERYIIAGAPQGSIDGLFVTLQFITINDLVFFVQYSLLNNNVGDNNFLLMQQNKEDIYLLLSNFKTVNNCFSENVMV